MRMGDSALNLALKPQKAVAHFMGLSEISLPVTQPSRAGLYAVAHFMG